MTLERNGHFVLDTAPVVALGVDAHPCAHPVPVDTIVVDWIASTFCMPSIPLTTMLTAMEVGIASQELEAIASIQ